MATNPTLLTQPIAANGAKNAIPNTTATPGAMSQDQGFPAETALPLGAGGVAPTREDFNGAFNLLSGITFMAQKGWVFLFDENQDYFAGCTVRDPLDSKIYEAINDVSASSTHPSADSVNWKIADLSAYTKTINAPMVNKRDIIITSGTYTAPITGWYKITIKGGGGGGAGGSSQGNNIGLGGGGGGEGGTTIAYERMIAGNTATVVIGAGGTAGVGASTGTNGGNGGNTIVSINGSTYTANGGGGGRLDTEGGAGGAGTIYGCSGGAGNANTSTSSIGVPGGNGGGEGGSNGGLSASTSGVNGGGGSGGAGRTGNHPEDVKSGTVGGNGYVWFEYFDSTLNP